MTWRSRFWAIMPVPLAAPESGALRRMRLSILMTLVLLGAICLFWQDVISVCGIFAAALVAGLFAYLAVIVPVWLTVKKRADDAWLLRDRDND